MHLLRHVLVVAVVGCVAWAQSDEGWQPARIGMKVEKPALRGYSTESIMAFGDRMGIVKPIGTNCTAAFNEAMGRALEKWNAHNYSESVQLFKRIFEQTKESPWAAEAELRVAIYYLFTSQYDLAEERFLSILETYAHDTSIQRKVYRYLFHIYFDTSRYCAARDALDMLPAVSDSWKDKQYYDNWNLYLEVRMQSAEEHGGSCGPDALLQAMKRWEYGGRGVEPRESCGVTADARQRVEQLATHEDAEQEGYSLYDLARLSGGGPIRLNYTELSAAATPDFPILVHLKKPAPARLYEQLQITRNPCRKEPAGHFWVICAANEAYLDVLDSESGLIRVPKAMFEYRWSGLALELPGQSIEGAQSISTVVAESARGTCCCPPPTSPTGPEDCTGCSCGSNGGMGGPPPGPPPGAPPGPPAPTPPPLPGAPPVPSPGGGDCGSGCNSAYGSPVYDIGISDGNLSFLDKPIWYPKVDGPSLEFALLYNKVSVDSLGEYTNVNYHPVGRRWSHSFLSYMIAAAPTNIEVALPNARVLTYMPTTNGYVALQMDNQRLLSITNNLACLSSAKGDLSYFYRTNENMQLVRIENKYGKGIDLHYDALLCLTSVVDSAGRSMRLDYDPLGYITNIVDLLGRTCTLAYSNGNLASITDMGGYRTAFTYSWDNHITNVLYPSGNVFESRWPSHGIRKIVFRDSLHRTNEYVWDGDFSYGPVFRRYPSGAKWGFSVDKDAFGTVDKEYVNCRFPSSYKGDTYRRRQVDGEGNVVGIGEWNTNAYPQSTAFSRASYIVTNLFTTNHLVFLRQIYYPSASPTSATVAIITSNTYDEGGHLIRVTGPMGSVVGMGYDDMDNLVAITNPLGHASTLQYDNDGHLVGLVDPRSNTVLLTYTDAGQVAAAVMPDGSWVSNVYDVIGRRVSVMESSGFSFTNTYDDLDRVTQVSYPDGSTVQYQYGCCGVERFTDRMGRETVYDRDVAKRITAVTGPDSNTVHFGYNAANAITTIAVQVDGNPRTTRFDYVTTNGFTRLESRISPLGRTTRYAYAFRGWLTNKVDAMGRPTEYAYDVLGRLTNILYGAGTNVSLSYDLEGRVTDMTDWCSTNRYGYDAAGQVTSVVCGFHVPDFSPVSYRRDYQYDAVGNATNVVLWGLNGFTNVIENRMTYDSMNRMASLSNAWADCSYDFANGHVIEKAYGNGDITRYAYDLEQRLVDLVTTNLDGWVQGWSYVYNRAGMIVGISNQSSVANYEYDAIDQLVREVWTGGEITAWSYDEAGNRLTRGTDTGTNTYAYNADNELLGVTAGGANGITVLGQVDMPLLSNHWQNVLAEAGGQTASVSTSGTFVVANVPVQGGVNALPVTIADDHGNRVTQTVTFAVSEERTMSHDLNGNLTAITSDTSCVEYVWDRENRLVEVLDNGVTVLQCWYDGVGRRLAKREVVNGQTNAVQYLWDGWTVLAVLDGEGRMLEYYTRGLGIAGDIGSIVAETRFASGAPVATYYYHNNHRGDVTAVREGTNTLVAVDYRPFGAVRSSTGNLTPRFGFSSKERDPASGLDYFGYRYYSAEFGRWVSKDVSRTAALRGMVNRGVSVQSSIELYVHSYSMCRNNVVNFIDAEGMEAIKLNDVYMNPCPTYYNPTNQTWTYGGQNLMALCSSSSEACDEIATALGAIGGTLPNALGSAACAWIGGLWQFGNLCWNSYSSQTSTNLPVKSW